MFANCNFRNWFASTLLRAHINIHAATATSEWCLYLVMVWWLLLYIWVTHSISINLLILPTTTFPGRIEFSYFETMRETMADSIQITRDLIHQKFAENIQSYDVLATVNDFLFFSYHDGKYLFLAAWKNRAEFISEVAHSGEYGFAWVRRTEGQSIITYTQQIVCVWSNTYGSL